MNDSKIRQSSDTFYDKVSVEFFYTTQKNEEYIIRATRKLDNLFQMIIHKTSGAKMQLLTLRSPILTNQDNSFIPIVSPDGKYIAFTYAGSTGFDADAKVIFEAYIYEIVDHDEGIEEDKLAVFKHRIHDSELTNEERFPVVSLKLHKHVTIPCWLKNTYDFRWTLMSTLIYSEDQSVFDLDINGNLILGSVADEPFFFMNEKDKLKSFKWNLNLYIKDFSKIQEMQLGNGIMYFQYSGDAKIDEN